MAFNQLVTYVLFEHILTSVESQLLCKKMYRKILQTLPPKKSLLESHFNKLQAKSV